LAKRAFWGVADQALSSLSNFALTLLATQHSGASAFGAFAITLSAYAVLLEIGRGIVGIPLAISNSGTSSSESRHRSTQATGAALVLGCIGGALLVVAARRLSHGEVSSDLGQLGVVLPGLILQDTWRYAFFAQQRGKLAFINDAVWTVLFLSAAAVLHGSGGLTNSSLILAWGISATAAALVGCLQSRLLPHPRQTFAWLKATYRVGVRFALESLATTGTSQFAFFAIGAVVGLASLGAVRGAYLLLGPLNILFLGVMTMGIPEIARLFLRSPERVRSTTALASGVLAAAAALWSTAIFLTPSSVGSSVIGHIWHAAHSVLLPMSLFMVATGIQIGAVMALRGIGAAKQSLTVALIYSPVTLIAAMAGGQLGGGTGAAWGLVVGRSIAAAITWTALVRAATPRSLSATVHLEPTPDRA
jgi:O-antigen/teichoic acid export membrane protein